MSPDRGATRLLRAALFAAVCLSLAVAAHALGGGGVPSLVTVTLCGIPVLLGSVWLSGARRGPMHIGMSLTLAQAGLHVAFHRMAASSGVILPTDGHGVPSPGPVATSPEHLHATTSAHDLAGAVPSPAMLTWHIAAVAATAWVLWRGEETLWWLARLVFPRWVVPQTPNWGLVDVALPAPGWFRPCYWSGSISERGPPLAPVLT